MKAKYLFILIILIIFHASPAFSEPRTAIKYKWRIGTLAPQGVGYAIAVQEILLPELYEATRQELGIKIYWGGILGDDRNHIKQMEIGKLHGAGLSGQGSFLACPEVGVIALPFLFTGFEEVDYLKTKMITSFDAQFEKRGMKILFWVDQDFDQTYSTGKMIQKAEDFKGLRFVNWCGDLEKNVLERLGCEIVPEENVGNIPGMFKSGAIDAGVAPAIWMVGAQLYTVVRHVNPLRFRYTPAFIVARKSAFEKLPEEYRKNIENTRLKTAQRFCDRTRSETGRCLKAMFDYGVTEAKSSDEAVAEIRRVITPVWYEMAGKLYPPELLDEVLDYMAAYRSEKGVAEASAPAPAAAERAPAPVVAPAAAPAGGEGLMSDVNAIRFVQGRLRELGYYPYLVDGILGPITYRGIKKYQKDKGLPETGTVTPELVKSLGGR
jgi:TRAP-type C4-dicarboxylate transport system substrate-binding protein